MADKELEENKIDDYSKEIRKGRDADSKATETDISYAAFQSDVVKKTLTAIVSIANYIKDIPPIHIPDIGKLMGGIKIPEYLIETTEDYRFQKLCANTGWPLYRLDRESQKIIMTNSTKQDASSLYSFAVDYFDSSRLDQIMRAWKQCPIINKDHIAELSEAITLYKEKKYYGCVAICSCSILGLIDEIHTYAIREGVQFSEDYYSYLFELNNGGKTPDPGMINKVMNYPQDVISGKQQLICSTAGIEGSYMFWNEVSRYIYSVILTSDDKALFWEQPNRNKICHGAKMNYGTKEIAIKAILTIDLVYLLAKGVFEVRNRERKTTA